MKTTIKSNISILAGLLAKKGIQHIVLMPGSRNAPLSIAFNRQKELQCHVVVDERCGGFMALGMAQQSKKCVAVVCTSGTALLNLAPAVAEAYYQRLPLLIISADRPTAWIDQDDSQTIRQNNVFANFIKKSFTLPEENESKDNHWFANRIVNEAVDLTKIGRMGPVHLNVPIDNPLYDTTNKKDVEYNICNLECERHLSADTKQDIQNKLNNKKVLWLFGFMQSDTDLNENLDKTFTNKGGLVLAESLSNIYGEQINNNVEAYFAYLLKEKIDLHLDTLMVSGGAIVSKSAKIYFRSYPPKELWYIGKEESIIDTYQHVSHRFDLSASEFAKELNEINYCANRSFANEENKRCKNLQKDFNNLCEQEEWGEKSIFHTIFEQCPTKSIIHLSNGTSVRNGLAQGNAKHFEIYSNRGTSGIDGSTSTAVGHAMLSTKKVTLITGDLSFLYDSNALWNNEFPENLTIIVINNHGGGIFSKLKGPKDVEEFEKFFYTPQHISIKKLVEAYGLNYHLVRNKKELATFINLPGVVEVEITL